MPQFRIRTDAFPEIRKQALARAIPTLAISLVCGMAIGAFSSDDWTKALPTLLPIVGLMLLVYTYAIWRGVKRLDMNMESYLLVIENEVITRNTRQSPEIGIPFGQVKEIQQHVNGSIRILGHSAQDIIHVPAEIEEREAVLALLDDIRPVSKMSQLPWAERLRWPILFITLGLFAGVYLSDNKVLVATSAALYGLLMGTLVYMQLRGPRLGLRGQVNLLFSFIILIAVMVLAYSKLSAG